MINWLFRDRLSLAMIVDDVLLKNQVTSYFLEKNITAITKVITDVWRKGWARSIVAFSLGQGDALAGLAVLKPGETSGHCLGETDGRVTVAGGGVTWFPPVSRQTQHLHARDVWLAICLREHPPRPKHGGRPGCSRARFGSAAASSDRFKLLQDNVGTDKSFS